MLLKNSFVIHLCCLKKCSVKQITISPKRYKLVTPHGTFWIAKQIKTLFLKTPFDLRHLTSSSTTLYISNNTLSEETLQRKHTYVTTYPRLPTTNQLLQLKSSRPKTPCKHPVQNGDIVNEQQPSDRKTQPYEHASFHHERKKTSETSRKIFKCSRRTNFKDNARWTKITTNVEFFQQNLMYQHTFSLPN